MFIGKHVVYQRWTLILVVISHTACTPALERVEDTPIPPTPTTTAPVCQPSEILTDYVLPEIQATMNSEGEIWALLFFGEAHANEELKIVWRIDAPEPGTEVQFQAHNEEETIVQPI